MLRNKWDDFKKTPAATAVVTTLVYGLFVHLFGLTNSMHNYDDIAVQPTGVGATLSSGRWFLEILKDWGEKYADNYNLPWLSGVGLLLFLALAAGLLVSVLKMKNK